MAHGSPSYPHPVLGNADDIDAAPIEVSVDYEICDENISLHFSGLRTGHDGIDALMADGSAVWLAKIQCGSTYFRECHFLGPEKATVRLDARKLRNRIEIELHMAARRRIEGYRPSGLHADYGDASFILEPGDVIAVGGVARIVVDKDFDPLKATAASIVRVLQDTRDKGPFKVVLEADRIEIHLSKEDWTLWNATKNMTPNVLHASFILPALTHALARMQSERDGLEGLPWADRLTALVDRLPEEDSSENSLTVAQALLGNPVSRGMNDVLRLVDEET